MKPVPVRIVSALKQCRNHAKANVNISTLLTRTGRGTGLGMALPPPPPNQLHKPPFSSSSYGNPCLDIYFNVVKPDEDTLPAEAEANHNYLKQLLPLAWSHNPLTTLKLICNLLDRHCGGTKDHDEGFYTAAFWLHHNHPKTLASNLLPISGYFGSLGDLVQILNRILSGQDARRRSQDGDWEDDWDFKMKMMGMDYKVAVERYHRDPDYRILHDRVSDLFTHCLNCDIQNLKRRMMDDDDDDDDDESKFLEITQAAQFCDDGATLLCETVARNVFLPEEYKEGVEEEANYAYKVRNRLRKEVLEPLRKASDILIYASQDSNKWGYRPNFEKELERDAKKYLEDVKSGNCEIEASALLPHDIIKYLDDVDVGQVAELQWKAMVEQQKLGRKTLNNSLAVCNVSSETMTPRSQDVSVGLGLLVSQLSEEPAWKGKLINFSLNPKLHSISLNDDLKYKSAFVRSMDCPDWDVDYQKVFDLILEVAMNENLEPEQMINKVFVITYKQFFDFDGFRWAVDYEAIQRKYKETGYGNVVPQLVVWDLFHQDLYRPPMSYASTQHGPAMLKGSSNNLIKSFLDNDGEICPHHVMEAAISAEPYQSLVVVD